MNQGNLFLNYIDHNKLQISSKQSKPIRNLLIRGLYRSKLGGREKLAHAAVELIASKGYTIDFQYTQSFNLAMDHFGNFADKGKIKCNFE